MAAISAVLKLMGQILNWARTAIASMHIFIVDSICDWILENGSKSHIFISVYLSL